MKRKRDLEDQPEHRSTPNGCEEGCEACAQDKQEPDIWLNDSDENLGEMDCGCLLIDNYQGSGNPAFWFCPLHAAAEEMLGMLYDNASAWDNEEDSVKEEHAKLIYRLKKVIAKAEGKQP